jgi:hypothetical protein
MSFEAIMKNENDVSKEEILSTIVAQAKEYAAIDFEQLERDGVIKKVREVIWLSSIVNYLMRLES